MNRVTRLIVKNIGIVADSIIEFNKPLIILYGEIKQGKTTFLKAVRWVFGGSFPADIIRNGQEEAQIKLEFANGDFIERSFYKARDGSTKARDVKFVRDGKAVGRPTEEIRRFLNPFLLDQDHLAKMNELERKKFFLELFEVDTRDLDASDSKLGQQAHELRIRTRAYGDIDTTPVAAVDSEALKAELATVRKQNSDAVGESQKQSYASHERHTQRTKATEYYATWSNELDKLEKAIIAAKREMASASDFLSENPELPLGKAPELQDTVGLETRIEAAAAQNERHLAYKERLNKLQVKQAEESKISELEAQQRELRAAKLLRLQAATEKCGIPGLVFTEDGFTYEGCQPGMLSTSQLMKLSSALSSLYPEGFGLDLLDRGESLGCSIFEYIDRAKSENKTILATVVGEKPAVVPADVGVFVVQDGSLL